jgi:hypothetical protein
MYARVARFEGAQGDALRREAQGHRRAGGSRSARGRARERHSVAERRRQSSSLGIALFDTADDLRQASKTLNSMNPSSDAAGQRTSLETYEGRGRPSQRARSRVWDGRGGGRRQNQKRRATRRRPAGFSLA